MPIGDMSGMHDDYDLLSRIEGIQGRDEAWPRGGDDDSHRAWFPAAGGRFTVVRLLVPQAWWERLFRRPREYTPIVVWTPEGSDTGYAVRRIREGGMERDTPRG